MTSISVFQLQAFKIHIQSQNDAAAICILISSVNQLGKTHFTATYVTSESESKTFYTMYIRLVDLDAHNCKRRACSGIMEDKVDVLFAGQPQLLLCTGH